ncbi:MAG: ATP-dependent DNA ligase, partial [Nitrososphaerales archaeon]
MKFSLVADTLSYMESTTKRLELTQHLVDLFKITPPDIIPKVVYLLQGKLRPDHEGVEIGIAEKIAIRALSKSSGISVKKIEHEYKETGDFGQVASKILEQKTQTTFLNQDITVERVYDTLYKIAELKGARSQDMKMKYISSLLNDATPTEGGFIAKIITSNLRLGIADYTILDALSVAYTGSKENRPVLEHAYNVCSDLGKVSQAVSKDGINSLKDFQVKIFSPIRPMLAERVKSPQEAQEKMGLEFASEYKLDGERVQVHRQGEKIILYSRSLENITNYYPDIVENIGKSLKSNEVILEAE